MEITFQNYIDNPMSRKNMVFSNRQVYANLYKEKLDKILVREAGKIQYQLFSDSKSGDYYCYLKIPSEPIAKFYYDVVIRFYTNDQKIKESSTLKNYYVQFYSNDPAYVYTFAHAMRKNNLFIDDLKPVMSKIALRKVASERNPKDEVGYVKSLFFAYLTMVRYALFDKVSYKSYGKPYDAKSLVRQIMPADEKIEKRQELGRELESKNKHNKGVARDVAQDKVGNTNSDTNLFVNSSGKIAYTKKTPKTRLTRKTHRIKRI